MAQHQGGGFIHVGQRWLAQLGRLRVPEAPPVPYHGMIDEYADYLRQEKGLSSYTIDLRCGHISRFLSHFYAEHRRIDNLSNEDIDRFIIKKGRHDGHARSTVKTFVISLRCFLRYAEMREWCRRGLAASILAPRVYKHELIPLGPSWSDVQKLIAGTASDCPPTWATSTSLPRSGI
jgi:integrase/recombinase XerD